MQQRKQYDKRDKGYNYKVVDKVLLDIVVIKMEIVNNLRQNIRDLFKL